jgi:hypothetical protein
MKNSESKNYDLHPAWIVGFIDGEGTFIANGANVGINKNKTMKLGSQVLLEFVITQHKKDFNLMVRLKDFFNCGYLINDGPDKIQYRIRGLNQLEENLFPLLDRYPLQTIKGLDALAFREVYKLMRNNEHLTERGLEKIKEIKSQMNRSRIYKDPF